jgi:hypothetical protein
MNRDCVVNIIEFINDSKTFFSLLYTCKEFYSLLSLPNTTFCENIIFTLTKIPSKKYNFVYEIKNNFDKRFEELKEHFPNLKEHKRLCYTCNSQHNSYAIKKYFGINTCMDYQDNFNENDIKTLMDRVSCCKIDSFKFLVNNGGDILEAVMLAKIDDDYDDEILTQTPMEYVAPTPLLELWKF